MPKSIGKFTYFDNTVFNFPYNAKNHPIEDKQYEERYLNIDQLSKIIYFPNKTREICHSNGFKFSNVNCKQSTQKYEVIYPDSSRDSIFLIIAFSRELRSLYYHSMKAFNVVVPHENRFLKILESDINNLGVGRAVIDYKNGYVYEGETKFLEPNGNGKFIVEEIEYEGKFEMGNPVDFDGKAYLLKNYIEGSWKDYIGKGKILFEDGITYEGGFTNIDPHGNIKIYNDGEEIFEGVFNEGKIVSGKGKIIKGKNKISGIFENKIGNGTITNSEIGCVYHGTITDEYKPKDHNNLVFFEDGNVDRLKNRAQILGYSDKINHWGESETKMRRILSDLIDEYETVEMGSSRFPFTFFDKSISYKYRSQASYKEGESREQRGYKLVSLKQKEINNNSVIFYDNTNTKTLEMDKNGRLKRKNKEKLD